jgi:hypothetical protein
LFFIITNIESHSAKTKPFKISLEELWGGLGPPSDYIEPIKPFAHTLKQHGKRVFLPSKFGVFWPDPWFSPFKTMILDNSVGFICGKALIGV